MNASVRPALQPFLLGFMAVLAAAGCQSTGGGAGRTRAGDHATFQWQQSSPTTGELRAELFRRDGTQETYEGKFFQITSETQLDTLNPLWDGFYPAWVGWPYWGPVPQHSFITHYTGHVVANLKGPNGQHMRCHFRLLRAGAGMRGGGEGECQLPSGETIKADFPPS